MLAGLLCAMLMTSPGHAAEGAYQFLNAPTSGQVTSTFGLRTDPVNGSERFHYGLDIAAPAGTPIQAPQDGWVTFSGVLGGYGNAVVLQHTPGLSTLYGHASVLYVQAGEFVRRGQVLAAVGSTGRSTGPHLHFEVHQNNQFVNPADYLRYLDTVAFQGQRLQTATSELATTFSPRLGNTMASVGPTGSGLTQVAAGGGDLLSGNANSTVSTTSGAQPRKRRWLGFLRRGSRRGGEPMVEVISGDKVETLQFAK
jgi:hypothetical protein